MIKIINKDEIELLSENYTLEHAPIQPISKIDGDIIVQIMTHLKLNIVAKELLNILENYKIKDDSDILSELIMLNENRITYDAKEKYFIQIKDYIIDVYFIKAIQILKELNRSTEKYKYSIIINPSQESAKMLNSNIRIDYFDESEFTADYLELKNQLEKFNINFIK